MKIQIGLLAFAFLVVALISSCMSKEESVISRLNDISNEIAEKGDSMNSGDWEKLIDEYTLLTKEVVNEDYEFTDEQLTELGRVQGLILAQFAKHEVEEVKSSVLDFIQVGKGFADGFLEGLSN